MPLRPIRLCAFAAVLLAAGPAPAQQAGTAADPHAGHAMAPMTAEAPAACTAATAPKGDGKASGMPMESAAGGNLGPVPAGNMAAMALMHGPMMQAATIEDADLAFNCGMIAHHRGAIAMAKVELEHGKDPASRALAEAIVAAQEKEIAAMTAWVEARGK